MNYYKDSVEEVFNKLSSQKEGLDENEIPKRQKQYGRNILEKQQQISLWSILIDQFTNPVIYLLIAATAISFFFNDIPEGIAISVVIILNAAIGFWMEFQARQSMQALKKMDKLSTRVKRNNKEQVIDAEELVPGDILILEAGQLMPADTRLIEVSELAADESPLTGESVPVEKNTEALKEDTPISDQSNMAFKGTSLTNGKGIGIVTGTGMQTQLGEISRMVSEAGGEEIPLNKKLVQLTHALIWVILGLAAAYLIFGWVAGKEFYLLLQTAIAWSIAAIPEGLPIVASIALAKGMLRLAKQQVIVKKLSAVETLGETTIIFTDKTGTLTENNLSVATLHTSSKRYQTAEHEEKNTTDKAVSSIQEIAVLCNNAQIEEERSGDPLEIALLDYMKEREKEEYQQFLNLQRKHEDPFDSESKRMGTIHETDNGFYMAAKGAADAILERTKYILLENGEIKEINQEEKNKWLESNEQLSSEGLRVLAFAYRVFGNEDKHLLENDDFLADLILAGLVGFIDPPRKEVASAIDECHSAGIKVAMITGDHPATSLNIARQVHLVGEQDKDVVIHGSEITHNMDDTTENKRITGSRIFARVDPRQKLDIVDHFQHHGDIVGMTGDGVNDAPALKEADIGIAMGKRGTQAAQEVADMVLKDDSFPSIVKAIEQGRIIFGNIRKFIIYQLSYHLSEIILIASISFTMFHLPILPLQLLFLNLLSDVFPALALSLSKGDPNIMALPPKNPEEPIITRQNWLLTGYYGIVLAIFITGAYLYAYFQMDLGKEISNNVAFFTLAFAQLLHVFNMRESNEPILINQITKNKYIWGALGLCTAILLGAYFIPGLREILSFQNMTAKTWLLITISSICPLIFIQAGKIIYRKSKKVKN